MDQGQGPDSSFRSDVTPPPRPRPTVAQLCGRIAFGATVIAGLIASVVLGTPALHAPESGSGRSVQHTADASH
ncbi:hypothetical protein [Peterkaempfera bronchialis]|uniref:Uncharacterized protein n=1 Tax=Peterkaempfera bronchialis TaxID=2126346 RepID=A0A345SRU8_9ACTN|nr:hypothetical protein [Peterkaempfera bronchialis]AXI76453.1 hypothetical protein C7M71_002145 [Peterkaempfera bronchialis]